MNEVGVVAGWVGVVVCGFVDSSLCVCGGGGDEGVHGWRMEGEREGGKMCVCVARYPMHARWIRPTWPLAQQCVCSLTYNFKPSHLTPHN
jgi:hypothetical protein